MAIENKRKLYQLEVINGTDPVSPTKDVLYLDVKNKQLKVVNSQGVLEAFDIGGTTESSPKIYSGTSNQPPAEWKDGDIYIMFDSPQV